VKPGWFAEKAVPLWRGSWKTQVDVPRRGRLKTPS